MPTVTEPQLLTIQGWTVRLRSAQAKPGRLLILVHGWMGDENSMWVLAQKLPTKYEILAPRAPFSVAEGGYSWREVKPGTWGKSSLEDLRKAVEALLALVDDYSASAGMADGRFDLMGFSQGAAMAYALALLHPERVRRLAALSGFFPEGGDALLNPQKFAEKPIFVTHGRQDELIPIEDARRSVQLWRKSGALVSYCESDTGHRVSKECLRELEMFLGAL